MWIFFALAALVFNALETTTDKVALAKYKNIDGLSATFLRCLIFWLIFGIIGPLGILGKLQLFFPWPIILLGFLYVGSSLFYTYLLKRIEATSYAALAYVSPIFYLLIDSFIIKTHLSVLQTAGILLLSTGGIMFTLQPKLLKFKREFTSVVFWMFVYYFAVNTLEYYSFKYYFVSHRINEVSFWFNSWLVGMLVLLILMIASKKFGELWKITKSRYGAAVTLSKTFDATNAWLWLHAISLAAVSQVNATQALYPLIMIFIVFLAQRVFKFKAEEQFSQGNFAFKILATALLCMGGFFIK